MLICVIPCTVLRYQSTHRQMHNQFYYIIVCVYVSTLLGHHQGFKEYQRL
jgi:hypothetical protein